MQFPARVIARGNFREDQISIHHETFPELPADINDLVVTEWHKQCQLNPKLKAGDILAAKDVQLVDDQLVLRCGPSRYDLFMGTTSSAEVPEQHRHRAIGVMCVTVTKDNFVVFGVRSPQVDWGTLRHVVPACRMGLADIHPYAAIWREAKEELGLERNEFEKITCVGVVSDLTWGRLNFEFVFKGHISLTSEEVVARAKTAASAKEHCHIDVFPDQGEYLIPFLRSDPAGWVPTGWAGTVLATWTSPALLWEPAHRTYAEHMGRRLSMLIK